MQKKHQQNWIKLGNIRDRNADAMSFVEQWIEHNADLQILKRYKIEKSDLLPPKHSAQNALPYVIRWRKALQQYKGRWQWREVVSYVFVEVGAVDKPKPLAQKTQKINQIITEQTVSTKTQNELPTTKVSVSEAKHVSKRPLNQKQQVDKARNQYQEPKTQDKTKKNHKTQPDNGNNSKNNKKISDTKIASEIKPIFVSSNPVVLHGLDQNKTKLYSRRPLVRSK